MIEDAPSVHAKANAISVFILIPLFKVNFELFFISDNFKPWEAVIQANKLRMTLFRRAIEEKKFPEHSS